MSEQVVECLKDKRVVKVFYCEVCDEHHEICLEDLEETSKRCPDCERKMEFAYNQSY